jgi:predicted DNA-binding transcriptional regulator AlpA
MPELQAVLNVARSLAPEELPRFLGELETVRAVAWSRLTPPSLNSQARDELLDVEAAANRLHMSASYLYRHHDIFPFTRKVGRSLRFSSAGIESYISESGVLTPRRRRAIVALVEDETK